jgi:ATP-dependent RNA helicase DDX46/PRP5
MAYLVGDCSSHQALENEDGERNRSKSCHVSSHHHRDVEPEAAPTTRDQEEGMGAEQQWLDDKMKCHRIRIKDWQEKPPRAAGCRWAQA